MATDIALTPDGDFILEDYDIKLTDDAEYLKQQAQNRIKSIKVDWRYDHIGADMEDLIGQANTTDTAQWGTEKLTEALTFDGLFDVVDLYIKPIPLDKSTVVFFVFINSQLFEDPYSLLVEIDLQADVTVKEV